MLRTSKQIRAEASAMYYASNEFRFNMLLGGERFARYVTGRSEHKSKG